MAVILEFPTPNVDAVGNVEIVTILKSYLRRSQEGDIRSLTLAVIGSDGRPECAMEVDRADATSLIGTLKVAQGRIASALDAVIE